MKGMNELVLNKASMLEAMSLWLEANFKQKLLAVDIEETKSQSSFTLKIDVPLELGE